MNRISILLALSLAASACTANVGDQSTDDNRVDVDDPAGKEDGVVRPVGTFDVEGDPSYSLVQVTLFTDKTFHAIERRNLRCPVGANCNVGGVRVVDSEIEGSYRYTRSGSSRYIRLSSDGWRGGLTSHRYRYTYDARDQELTLKFIFADGGSEPTQVFSRAANAYCTSHEQCQLQELGALECRFPTEWDCSAEHVCRPGPGCDGQ